MMIQFRKTTNEQFELVKKILAVIGSSEKNKWNDEQVTAISTFLEDLETGVTPT